MCEARTSHVSWSVLVDAHRKGHRNNRIDRFRNAGATGRRVAIGHQIVVVAGRSTASRPVRISWDLRFSRRPIAREECCVTNVGDHILSGAGGGQEDHALVEGVGEDLAVARLDLSDHVGLGAALAPPLVVGLKVAVGVRPVRDGRPHERDVELQVVASGDKRSDLVHLRGGIDSLHVIFRVVDVEEVEVIVVGGGATHVTDPSVVVRVSWRADDGGINHLIVDHLGEPEPSEGTGGNEH
mmetsp:Transcript_24359/g.50598  ORF Transcript_24359/g.50598 Transcript_24359/m.50598 type:complete len:240 (-) Transcript_24359:150-869(-)